MLAWLDAQPAAGRFPLVVYAPGAGGWGDENADLCEYLASHGYVVVAGPGLGTRAKRSAYTLEDAETGARDVEFVLGHALSMPQVDATRIAALGWSWGGMANVLAAARDDRISAIVSLDGTREPAFTKSIDPRTLTAPWLYVSRTPDTIPQINKAEIDTTFSLLNAARFADVYQLTMYPMRHVDFVSRHLRESGAADFDEYSQAEVADAYGSVALYVLRFLDAYLKGDASSAAFLHRTPRENGVAVHSMRVDVHDAEALPPSG
jgi:dienelactone hydrolase